MSTRRLAVPACLLAPAVAVALAAAPARAAPHVAAEYSLPGNPNLAGLVAGPDGREWVAGDQVIDAVSPSGQVTSYPAQALGTSIAVGPDGALWFGAKGVQNLGRITTSGQISYVSLAPPAGSFFIPLIAGLVTGPDGALWMTDYSNAQVIRYVPGGQPASIPLGAGSVPYGITVGPDAALWVADRAARVERVTLAGAVSVIGLPGFAGTESITVGGDGNLWINNSNGGLGRVTPAGQVTAFPVPKVTNQAADVQFVAADRLGNIWFNAWYAYPVETVGIMNTAGNAKLLRVPTKGSGAYALAQGPGGTSMWFTEAFVSQVGVATR